MLQGIQNSVCCRPSSRPQLIALETSIEAASLTLCSVSELPIFRLQQSPKVQGAILQAELQSIDLLLFRRCPGNSATILSLSMVILPLLIGSDWCPIDAIIARLHLDQPY
jgi:hypothetical protein